MALASTRSASVARKRLCRSDRHAGVRRHAELDLDDARRRRGRGRRRHRARLHLCRRGRRARSSATSSRRGDQGQDALAFPAAMAAMLLRRSQPRARGHRRDCAISAVDAALWDLKGKLLGLPVFALLGAARDAVPIYGSGGFTSYAIRAASRSSSAAGRADGMRWVKMKAGSDPSAGCRARQGGPRGDWRRRASSSMPTAPMTASRRWRWRGAFAALGVGWFEEPVSSDDLEGLRLCATARRRGCASPPASTATTSAISAACSRRARSTCCRPMHPLPRHHRLLAGRCALRGAFGLPLSAHCAPALHLHAALAATRLWNQEWFHDHAGSRECCSTVRRCRRTA